jgi:hypothetical protein
MTTANKHRLTVEQAIYAVDRLLSWQDNEGRNPNSSTFAKFLSLTDNMEGGTVWATPCGYLECSLLATALEAWATHPADIRDWLDSQGV